MEITVDDQGLSARLERGPGVTGKATLQAMRRIGRLFETTIKGEFLSGQMLRVRTGTGRRSIFHRIEAVGNGDEGDIVLFVGADLGTARYMRLQALGGIIRPTKGRYLTIPIGAAKTANGVARFSARDVIEDPQAHGYDSTFFRNQILFGVKGRFRKQTVEGQRVSVRQGSIGTVEPLFVLKTSVTIPAHNYLAAARDRLQPAVAEELGNIGKALIEVIVTEKGPAGGTD